MAPEDVRPKAGDTVFMDSWLGYPKARDRLLAGLAQRAAGRTVVLTGDIHNNWVYDIRRGFDVTQRPVIATEFVGTSIASGGDGSERASQVTDEFLAARPSLKWHNNRRGYVVCEVTAAEWRTHYRVVEYISRAGAPLVTATSWRLAHGRPGVERA
jgi:alkaline phosphatase D